MQQKSGSGISWTICKSAPCHREITMPVTSPLGFYQHDAMLVQVYATAFPSVCQMRAFIKMAKHFVKILLPPDSPIILVFRHRRWLLNSNGFSPNRCAEYKGVRKLGDIWPISWCILQTVLDMAIVAIEVEQETRATEWCHFQWPSVTPPPVSRSAYSPKANISQTVHATAGNMMSSGFVSDS